MNKFTINSNDVYKNINNDYCKIVSMINTSILMTNWSSYIAKTADE